MDIKSLILEKYLRIALTPLKTVSSLGNCFQFKCNVCGDGKHKHRGYLLKSKSRKTHGYFWAFKCFNDGCKANGEGNAWPAEGWLKYTNKNLHDSFVKEFLTSNNFGEAKKDLEEQIKKHEEKILKEEKENKKRKLRREKKELKHFVSINKKIDICDVARNECIRRKIPENIWKKWYVSTDGLYKNRMIIPFFGKGNKITYFQGRTLYDDIPKYLNRLTNKESAIYNIENIDRTKPVIVLEGPVDSMFIENAIAVMGTDISEERQQLLIGLDLYYLWDNDKAGRRKSEECLLQGKKVFLWNKFLYSDCKDINEIVIKYNKNNFSFKDLKSCFSKNYYDIMYLRDSGGIGRHA